LTRVPFGVRQYYVWMKGVRWPAGGQPVSLTRVVTALRKALVTASVQPAGGMKAGGWGGV